MLQKQSTHIIICISLDYFCEWTTAKHCNSSPGVLSIQMWVFASFVLLLLSVIKIFSINTEEEGGKISRQGYSMLSVCRVDVLQLHFDIVTLSYPSYG